MWIHFLLSQYVVIEAVISNMIFITLTVSLPFMSPLIRTSNGKGLSVQRSSQRNVPDTAAVLLVPTSNNDAGAQVILVLVAHFLEQGCCQWHSGLAILDTIFIDKEFSKISLSPETEIWYGFEVLSKRSQQ